MHLQTEQLTLDLGLDLTPTTPPAASEPEPEQEAEPYRDPAQLSLFDVDYQAFWRTHRRRAVRAARRLSWDFLDADEAEAVVQAVMVQTWRRHASFDPLRSRAQTPEKAYWAWVTGFLRFEVARERAKRARREKLQQNFLFNPSRAA